MPGLPHSVSFAPSRARPRPRGGAGPPHTVPRAHAPKPAGAVDGPGPAPPPLVTRRRSLLGLAPLACSCPACSPPAGGARRKWYDAYFAAAMAHQMGTYEAAIAPTKARVFDALLGPGGGGAGGGLRLLEVGIGTGPNLGYMARALGPDRLGSLEVVGLDPNPEMQPFCRGSAAAAGLGEGQLRLVEGSAEAMPFEDGAFDAAVITLVLCSVPDPAAALSEIRRVVAPGGRLALIEHVAAAPAARPLVALGQRLLDPLQGLVADGCHLTRDTGRVLERQGFDTSGVERLDVAGLGILAPHIAGIVPL